MEFSLPAWLGALAGTIVAVAIYVPGIRAVERHLGADAAASTADERTALANKLSIIRRVILAADIAILATVGYWTGNAIGGTGAAHPTVGIRG
jgi:hypothetical protein